MEFLPAMQEEAACRGWSCTPSQSQPLGEVPQPLFPHPHPGGAFLQKIPGNTGSPTA